MYRPVGLIAGLVASLLVSCGPVVRGPASEEASSQPAESRTFVLAIRYEPSVLAMKVLQSNGASGSARLLNATLSLIDDQSMARPYLAEALPQLNTDTWRVTPDGRMETAYRLRPNLAWQDGAPLTAEDFSFAFRVYKNPGLGVFISAPQNNIDAVLAPDPQTVLIQWRSLNPSGGSLTFGDLDPLPKHLLEASFEDYAAGRATGETFLNSAFWTKDYVGAGPYRLDRWDPGVQFEGTAYEGHVLGRPKIDRIVVRIFIDENSTLAAILAGGQLDYACCNTLRFEQLVTLKQQWESAGKGVAGVTLGTAVFLFQQLRPEYVGDKGLLDLRVRRAMAHAIDRQAINDGVFSGLGAPTDTPVQPNVPFFPDVERLTTKYPLDVNRTAQLMSEAGYSKDGDGFFADAQRNRFHLDFAVQTASEIERMQQVLSDSWKRAGFDVRTVVMGTQIYTAQETRQTLPGVAYAFFTGAEGTFRSTEIGSASNRWSGNNRSGWVSADYDRLYESWSSTLDLTERGKYVAQLMALISENLPGYSLYFSQGVKTWVSGLQGPNNNDGAGFGQTIKGTTGYWDIERWTLR